MAETLTLEAQTRDEKGKSVKKLRRVGFIPAVVYGQGKAGMSIKILQKKFLEVIKGHSTENLIVTLKLSGQKKSEGISALIRDVQIDPLKDSVIHVDFQEVSLEQKIRTKVRVENIGTPVGVAQEGGILECTLREVEIECLPMNIPEVLTVDVSNLKLGTSLCVRDIAAPEGVEILTAKDISVFSVAMPKVEEEAPKEAEITEPEVIGKKKEAAEGPEGEAAPKKDQPQTKEAEKPKEAEKKK